jgi:hypothetical protein
MNTVNDYTDYDENTHIIRVITHELFILQSVESGVQILRFVL